MEGEQVRKTSSDSFRMPFQGGITSVHNRQYQEKFMTSKSRLRLQLNFFNRRERECHCNRFQCAILQRLVTPKFHIAQPDNDESSRKKYVEHFQLLSGFIQLQELQEDLPFQVWSLLSVLASIWSRAIQTPIKRWVLKYLLPYFGQLRFLTNFL